MTEAAVWPKGNHPIDVATVQVAGRTRFRDERRFVVGSDASGFIHLGPRTVTVPASEELRVRGGRTSTQLVGAPRGDLMEAAGGGVVVAAVTSVTGRAWRESRHSMQWEIGVSGAGVGAGEPLRDGVFAVSVDRRVERGSRFDALKGAGVFRVAGAMRDAIGMDVMTVETAYTVRRIGTSWRPLGTRMSGSFHGKCRTLSVVPLPVAALALYLILRPIRSIPTDGEFIVSGG